MKQTEAYYGEKIRFSVSPWALLAAAALVYYSKTETVVPFLRAVLWHEMGHVSVLLLLGCRIEEIRMELSGLCIRYAGDPGSPAQAAASLAGPLAGLLYAFSVRKAGSDGELSACISVWLSAFNMIPALPLDGGRFMEALFGSRAAGWVGMISSVLLAMIGTFLFCIGEGISLSLSGIFLVLYQVTLISAAP